MVREMEGSIFGRGFPFEEVIQGSPERAQEDKGLVSKAQVRRMAISIAKRRLKRSFTRAPTKRGALCIKP